MPDVRHFLHLHKVEDGALRLQNVPVPTSLNYFIARHPWLFLRSDLVRTAATLVYRRMSPGLVTVPDPTAALL